MKVSSLNVGRIAERIAMNELEFRGYHIIDLAYMSKTSANVDFIASKDGKSFNVQVKGASNPNAPAKRWWVQYGYCDEAAVKGERKIFNSKTDFALTADVIVLVAVQSPSNYRAVILPTGIAEQAAQTNMDGYYRRVKASGDARQPGKLWTDLEPSPNPKKLRPTKDAEQALLKEHWDAWDALGGDHLSKA